MISDYNNYCGGSCATSLSADMRNTLACRFLPCYIGVYDVQVRVFVQLHFKGGPQM